MPALFHLQLLSCVCIKNSPSPPRGGSGPVFSKLMTTPLWTFCTRDSRHWFSIRCVRTQYDRPERIKLHNEFSSSGKNSTNEPKKEAKKKRPNLPWLHTSAWSPTHLWGHCRAARCPARLLPAASAPERTAAGPSEKALWWARCQPEGSSAAGAAARRFETVNVTTTQRAKKLPKRQLYSGCCYETEDVGATCVCVCLTSSGTPELFVSLFPSVMVMITDGSRKNGLRPWRENSRIQQAGWRAARPF